MSIDFRTRLDGVERAIQLLSQEEECCRKLPFISDMDVRSLVDLFIIKGSPRSLSDDNGSPTSVFQASLRCSHGSVICLIIFSHANHFKHIPVAIKIFAIV